jgi:carboxyl-terminal processing protease
VQQLEEEAINGMLKNLDPHSQYIPASLLSAVNETIDGNFSGIGLQFNMMYDTIIVLNTIPKGPSEKAGIMAGDRMVEIEGQPVAGLKYSSNDIVKMLKGQTGSKVKIRIFRKGEPKWLDFELVRDKIPLFSVDVSYMLTPETGYIKVNSFSKTTMDEFMQALTKLKKDNMKQLVLDLRNNSGGLIDPAVHIAELFLPQGDLIVYTEGKNSPRQDYFSRQSDTTYLHIGLAVLVNEYSASASEILAGAIQDNDRGTIIGRRSYGKGLVQEQHEFRDHSALRITIARYYTPTGRCIQKPYNNKDKDEYYDDLNERFRHGELIQADSTHFNDSLMFYTPQGKIVYGGGGIMPEIFVPIDTAFYSVYYDKAMRRGLMYRFAFEYVDKNRKKLSALLDYAAIEDILNKDNIMEQFIGYTTKQGLQRNNRDLAVSGATIENLVTAYIARNILSDDGFYPVINKQDIMVQRAIKTFLP